jgi:hypothetical protein
VRILYERSTSTYFRTTGMVTQSASAQNHSCQTKFIVLIQRQGACALSLMVSSGVTELRYLQMVGRLTCELNSPRATLIPHSSSYSAQILERCFGQRLNIQILLLCMIFDYPGEGCSDVNQLCVRRGPQNPRFHQSTCLCLHGFGYP